MMTTSKAFRRSRRARVEAKVSVVEPGHPGRADFEVLDVSEGGLFLADDAAFAQESSMRVGVTLAEGMTVWAWGQVRWRGLKDGIRGVGLALSFDGPELSVLWRDMVMRWVQAHNLALLAGLRTN